jgi:hypothetical protein
MPDRSAQIRSQHPGGRSQHAAHKAKGNNIKRHIPPLRSIGKKKDGGKKDDTAANGSADKADLNFPRNMSVNR